MVDYKKEMYELISRLTEVMIKHVEELDEIESDNKVLDEVSDTDDVHIPVIYPKRKRNKGINLKMGD